VDETPIQNEKMDLVASLPFLIVNAIGIGALLCYLASWALYIFGWVSEPLHWAYGLVIAVRYYVQMFFVTGVRHRYFSHRTYKTSRWFQAVLAFLATGDLQKGIMWWAGHHRVHHKASDTPDDPHTTLFRTSKWQGFKWAHCDWILCGLYNDTPEDKVRDLAQFRSLRFLNRPVGYLICPVLIAVGMFSFGWAFDGPKGALWMLALGFFTSTTLLYHGTFSINSLAHMVGSRSYNTPDQSRNNWFLAIFLTMGEGWHNNHHADEFAERQGRRWWQLDFSHYILVLLSWARLIWDIRPPSAKIKFASA
jgi:stearoyl-CoA desaturase (Delta-9 desaturase)